MPQESNAGKHSSNAGQEEHPFATLSRALEEAGLGKGGDKVAVPPVPPATQPIAQKKPKIELPHILIREAAKLIFEYWERHAQERGLVAQPMAWADLSPDYQGRWCGIVSIALEMGIVVIMNDAIQYLDQTNGDMGGAFVKALRRYLRERLRFDLSPHS